MPPPCWTTMSIELCHIRGSLLRKRGVFVGLALGILLPSSGCAWLAHSEAFRNRHAASSQARPFARELSAPQKREIGCTAENATSHPETQRLAAIEEPAANTKLPQTISPETFKKYPLAGVNFIPDHGSKAVQFVISDFPDESAPDRPPGSTDSQQTPPAFTKAHGFDPFAEPSGALAVDLPAKASKPPLAMDASSRNGPKKPTTDEWNLDRPKTATPGAIAESSELPTADDDDSNASPKATAQRYQQLTQQFRKPGSKIDVTPANRARYSERFQHEGTRPKRTATERSPTGPRNALFQLRSSSDRNSP